jgi:hypothetical protein
MARWPSRYGLERGDAYGRMWTVVIYFKDWLYGLVPFQGRAKKTS